MKLKELWEREHSIHIPADDSRHTVETEVSVYGPSDDGIILGVSNKTPRGRISGAGAHMTPEQAKRLADLLSAAAEAASK